MNSKLKKNLIIASLIAFVICSLCSAFLWFGRMTGEVSADCTINGTIESEYFIGEEISIPSASFDVDGAKITVSPSIVFPDGSTKSTSSCVLSQDGTYKVRYVAKNGSKVYVDEVKFDVYKKLYEVIGGGSATYGAEEKFGGAKGVKVALTDDSVFRLNRKINLNDLAKDEPFITFHINPETKGYAELDNIYVKVIDAYNENNYFALKIEYFSDRLTAATDVGVFGYINSLTTVYSDAIVCAPQQALWRGWLAKASFVADDSENSLSDQSLSFYFSENEQRVFGEDLKSSQVGVLDLSAFPEKWSGLTNGDVYIEIFGDNFRATYANLFIDSLGNVDLNTNKLTDEDAPVITLDYDKFTAETYPNAYVGYTYKLFNATAFDEKDGEVLVTENVYYNFYSNNKSVVAIKDNCFKPDKLGVYTIVYTATDRFGNVAEEYVDVTVLSAEAVSEFKYNVSGEYAKECKVGEFVAIPEVSFTGGIGYIVEEMLIEKDGNNYNDNVEEDKFRALEAGVYTVKFTAKDYIGRVCEFSYSLSANLIDAPVFVDNPEKSVNANFIVGYENKLPKIKAVFVGSDNVTTDVPVTISTDNGTVNGLYYCPENIGKVTLTFTATINGKTTQVAIERKAYAITNDVGIDMKSLFIYDSNVNGGYSADGFAEYKITGTGKIEFLNTVLSENAFVKLQTDAQYKDISELNVRLYNPSNKNKVITINLKNFNGLVFASINGQKYQAVVNGDFSGSNAFDVSYAESTKSVSINGMSYSSGDAFKGLDSDYAVLEIEVVGTTESSVYGLIVEKVGNQSLKNDSVIDLGKPMIICGEDYGGIRLLGSVYTTPNVVAKDVVDPSLKSFVMSITAPDGTSVVIDGVEMSNVEFKQYSFELTSYGAYFFEFVATDHANRKETFSYAIIVPDLTAPQVSVEKGYTDSGVVGTAITVATFTATDNCDKAEDLKKTILLCNPNGNFKVINGSFTPDKAGRYTVYCYVTDAYGNVGLDYYNIEVK